MSQIEKVKCLIIGSGPAGLTAALYAGRANLNPVVYEGIEPGGQLTTTTDIENFPGYPEGIAGSEMMNDFKKQAQRFGADVRYGTATKADLSTKPFNIVIDNKHTIEAESVIIATGATAKYLGLKSETEFRGRGVSACATCDGFFYRNKVTAVVGGGDSACESALYLSGICEKVYMIVRRDVLRASITMQDRVKKNPKIEILFEHSTEEVLGDDNGVTGVLLRKTNGEKVTKEIDGFFLAIGHHPNTEVFAEDLELDDSGYIITQPNTTHTNIEGVFAAGDVQDSRYRQAITAAGSGCMAALDCELYFMTK